jgi:hypothetical protein
VRVRQQLTAGLDKLGAREGKARMYATQICFCDSPLDRGSGGSQDRFHHDSCTELQIGPSTQAFAETPSRGVAKARTTIRTAAVYPDEQGLWHKG